MSPIRADEVATWLAVPVDGDPETRICGVAPLESAGPTDLSFVGSRKAVAQAGASQAGCLIVPLDFPNPEGRTLIRVPDPRAAFARAVARLVPPRQPPSGVDATAVIDASAELDPGVSVGAHVTIGSSCRVGARSRIGPGCAIGEHVTIGEDVVLHANVTIYDHVEIGSRAILHSGCVIGADGFGFVLTGGRYEKFPQIGRVVLGDDVEIGANACVDRAALGVTHIGDGAKLDNMVHVGHNCRIGRHVVVAAQTGFSGGVVVEDYAVIGGQVGVGDKARIESRAVLGSGCGILTSKIVRSGSVVWGTPARPLKEHLEALANLNRLPQLKKELAELKARLEGLERAHDARRGGRT